MAAAVLRNPLPVLGRQLVAVLNAWSHAVARARAERRRREAQARAATASPLQQASMPR